MENRRDPELVLKLGFVAIGAVAVLAIVFGSWLWNLVFDPAGFDLVKWANDAVFNSCVSLAMMVLGFVAIGETLKEKEGGRYQRVLSAFNSLVEGLYETGRIVWFDQFVGWLGTRQAFEKKVAYLCKRGMGREDARSIVLYARISDLPAISGLRPGEKPTEAFGKDVVRYLPDGRKELIPAIKGTWAGYVEDVLTDKVTVDADDASYYLSASSRRGEDLTSLERPQETERERLRSLRFSIASKVGIGLVLSALVSMLAVDMTSDAGAAQALWGLIMRLCTAAFGFICGGFMGSANDRFRCKWLKEKSKVVRDYVKYLEAGEFVPRSREEAAAERIAAAEKPGAESLPEEDKGGDRNAAYV